MYCGTCGERIKNGEKICPFCGSEQTTLPQWKGISLDFISDKEEKEEPLEKTLKTDRNLSDTKSKEEDEIFYRRSEEHTSELQSRRDLVSGYKEKIKAKRKKTEKSIRYIRNSESINYNLCCSIDFVRQYLYQSIAEEKR